MIFECPFCPRKYFGPLNNIQAEIMCKEYGFCSESCRLENDNDLDDLRFQSTKKVVEEFLRTLGY